MFVSIKLLGVAAILALIGVLAADQSVQYVKKAVSHLRDSHSQENGSQ